MLETERGPGIEDELTNVDACNGGTAGVREDFSRLPIAPASWLDQLPQPPANTGNGEKFSAWVELRNELLNGTSVGPLHDSALIDKLEKFVKETASGFGEESRFCASAHGIRGAYHSRCGNWNAAKGEFQEAIRIMLGYYLADQSNTIYSQQLGEMLVKYGYVLKWTGCRDSEAALRIKEGLEFLENARSILENMPEGTNKLREAKLTLAGSPDLPWAERKALTDDVLKEIEDHPKGTYRLRPAAIARRALLALEAASDDSFERGYADRLSSDLLTGGSAIPPTNALYGSVLAVRGAILRERGELAKALEQGNLAIVRLADNAHTDSAQMIYAEFELIRTLIANGDNLPAAERLDKNAQRGASLPTHSTAQLFAMAAVQYACADQDGSVSQCCGLLSSEYGKIHLYPEEQRRVREILESASGVSERCQPILKRQLEFLQRN